MARIALALAAFGLALSGPVTGLAADCETKGSERKPVVSPNFVEIAGPNGPIRFRETSWWRRCTTASGDMTSSSGREGLADGAGRILVPAKYTDVTPISATTALVNTGTITAPVLRVYTLGRGEAGPAPYPNIYLMQNTGSIAVPYSIAKKGPVSDYHLWVGSSDTPLVLRNLEGLARRGNVLLAHFRAEDGAEVSRFLDLKGQPVSPVVGDISEWRFWKSSSADADKAEFVSSMGKFEHPLLPYGQLFMPLKPDGSPAPLPEGAMGVFPLQVWASTDSLDRSRRSDLQAFGWAVVYPTADGIEIAPVMANLAETLRQAPTARRYAGMQRRTGSMTSSNAFISDVMLVRSQDDGRWRPAMAQDLSPAQHNMGDAGFSDPDLAYRMYVDDRKAHQQRIVVAQDARKRQEDEFLRQQAAESWARVKAAGTLCSNQYVVQQLPTEAVNQYLRTCPVTDPWVLKNRSDADPAALAEGRRKYDAHVAKQWAENNAATRAKFGLDGVAQGGGGDPWAAGLAAAQAASQASMNAFTAQQNAVYQRNLKAWNSGAQNWCCGASPK